MTNPILSEPVAIIGTGVAGLITAHVLLQDGFTNVTLISRDRSVGGTWARERIYPGLHLNSVYGEYRFSDLEMPPPVGLEATGGNLRGTTMCNYMEAFSSKFLEGRATFRLRTELTEIKRIDSSDASSLGPWHLTLKQPDTGVVENMQYARLVLATGGCSNPYTPPELSEESPSRSKFQGLVFHSSMVATQYDKIASILDDTKSSGGERQSVVVVGGGKSAQDVCARLALEGRHVINVFENADTFLAASTPLPDAIRKSRFLSVLMAHRSLNTRLEWFLHKTWLGGMISRFIVNKIHESSFDAFHIPQDSPQRRTTPLFWSIRVSDDGCFREDQYHALVQAGKITLIAPNRVQGFSDDGLGVDLRDGTSLKAKVVILATGYRSSWSDIMSKEVADKIGISRYPSTQKFEDVWQYESLKNGPTPNPNNDKWVSAIYRGVVPAKSILRRDIAIAGAFYTGNPGYTNEVVAHWISGYFQGDKMRLPKTVEEATQAAERQSIWMKIRFPSMLSWVNESYSSSLDFWTWPQAADEFLEDMYLESHRSGGNWLTWPFKVIHLEEIKDLKEERRAIREGQVQVD